MSLTLGATSTITDDTYYNSWPSICRLPNGNLIVVYTKGVDHSSSNNAQPDYKISSNEGSSWGAEGTVIDHATLKIEAAGVSATSTGRVFVTLLRFDVTTPGLGEAGVCYSDDNGSTWSSFIALTNGFTEEAFGAGPVVELSNGDLLVTIEGRNIGTPELNRSSHTVRSTDNGATWGSEVTIRNYSDDSRPYYETCLLLLESGRLLAIHRTAAVAPGGTHYISTSDDEGLTWSAPYAAFSGYGRPHTIQTSSGLLVAVTRDNAGADAIVYTSSDDGVTWDAGAIFDTMEEMEYGCPVETTDNRILLVYGSQPTASTSNSDIKQRSTVETGEPGVWVDWDEDGFADSSSASEEGLLARIFPQGGGNVADNITADVIAFRWQRGGQGDTVGGAQSDGATIVVKNTSGKYNPDNSASSLYGRLRPGRPVWIGANADGTLSGSGQTVYGLFAGRVRDIAPIPAGGATDAPTAEIICDGILETYARTPTNVADSITRSQRTFRIAVLDDIAESAGRRDLAVEADTLPISSADSDNAVSVLEELNRANGTRHFIRPQSTKGAWYKYTTRNRMYKLGAAADSSLAANSEHVTEIDGWRVTNDTIINRQRATVDPLVIPVEQTIAWEYGNAPFDVTGNQTIWADFGEYVANPELRSQSSGATLTSSLTSFGHTARIDLSSTGANVIRLYVVGQLARREQAVTVTGDQVIDAAPSQAAFGLRSGQALSGDLLGAKASAQGIVDHITWRFAQPLMRPRVTIENWFPGLLARDLYDQLSITVSQLDASAKKFEIIGLAGYCDVAASATIVHYVVTYTLQQSRVQGTQTFFTLNTSTLNGADLLGY